MQENEFRFSKKSEKFIQYLNNSIRNCQKLTNFKNCDNLKTKSLKY